jgi:hypothetical protein
MDNIDKSRGVPDLPDGGESGQGSSSGQVDIQFKGAARRNQDPRRRVALAIAAPKTKRARTRTRTLDPGATTAGFSFAAGLQPPRCELSA